MSRKNIRDTDYLYATGRVRALERELLTENRVSRMIDAKSDEEALKVLYDCGYQDLLTSGLTLDAALREKRRDVFAAAGEFIPDKRIISLFTLKYDYHNIKTALKSTFSEESNESIFLENGRFVVKVLREKIAEDDLRGLPEEMVSGINEAREILGKTRDPQRADFVLDKAMFSEMRALADSLGGEFLKGYVKITIDASNLRAYVRAHKMGKGYELLRAALCEGGSAEPRKLLADTTGDNLQTLFPSLLEKAVDDGLLALKGEKSLGEFDTSCDNAIVSYLKHAKYIPFGEQPVSAYLYAKEQEFSTIRTIMAGRRAGLGPDAIRERLKEAYV